MSFSYSSKVTASAFYLNRSYDNWSNAFSSKLCSQLKIIIFLSYLVKGFPLSLSMSLTVKLRVLFAPLKLKEEMPSSFDKLLRSKSLDMRKRGVFSTAGGLLGVTLVAVPDVGLASAEEDTLGGAGRTVAGVAVPLDLAVVDEVWDSAGAGVCSLESMVNSF